MKFPLYLNDGKSICSLSEIQNTAISDLKIKIANGEYRFTENTCLCGNDKTENDAIISEKDRYGLPIASMLCSKCGLIRSQKTFDPISNIQFYQKDYRRIYVGSSLPSDIFFEEQYKRGKILLRKWENHLPNEKISTVFELGCGAGGILYPFKEKNLDCSGSDYDNNYLEYGRGKGLNLKRGDYNSIIRDNSIDLFILSHVMEHFLTPISDLQNIISKITPGGSLIIEVPSIFSIDKIYFNPLLYFQNAHVFSYYQNFLKIFFHKLGLNTIYSDERCIFILKKPNYWEKNSVENIFDNSLQNFPHKIKKYIYSTYWKNTFKLNSFFWAKTVVNLFKKTGLLSPIKSLRQKYRK